MNQNQPSFWSTNFGKTIITALYVGVSAILSYFITATTNDPGLFGPMTAFINIVLVFIVKTFFSESTPNVGSK